VNAESPPGIDVQRVTAWFGDQVGAARAPLSFDRVPGGRSNLTYIVADRAGNRWVLRRPPTGDVLPSAHNVLREWSILSRLQSTAIPLPEVVGHSADHEVTGADFYVMAYVDGVVLDGDAAAEAIPVPTRAQASRNIVDSLTEIHRVDCRTAEFDDLRRPGGYVQRQLSRWIKQLDAAGSTNSLLREVHGLLGRNPPPERWTGLVHGDFRPGNLILGPDGAVRAVLDWELCAIGDVLADLGWLVAVWTSREVIGWAPEPEHGFWCVEDVIERYRAVSGRDVSDVGYYHAFALWRLGCIADGVYARYRHGAMGDHEVDLEVLARRPNMLAAMSRDVLARG
jgi:aminoglycoside phosphotransferase (APT) family kinase protein